MSDHCPTTRVVLIDGPGPTCACCGKEVPRYEVYRCADCDMAFHKNCLKNVHFKEQVAPLSERDELTSLRGRVSAFEATLLRLQYDLRERLAATTLSRTQKAMLADIDAALAQAKGEGDGQ